MKYNQQRGAVLVVSLIILLLMTLIGVTAMESTNLQERMAGNKRDQDMAFQAAEAALVEAEEVAANLSSLAAFNSSGNNGYYKTEPGDEPWESAANWTDVSKHIVATNTPAGIRSSGKYIIEHFTTVTSDENDLNMGGYGQTTGAGDIEVIRITARATGGSDNSVSMIQATYGKKL